MINVQSECFPLSSWNWMVAQSLSRTILKKVSFWEKVKRVESWKKRSESEHKKYFSGNLSNTFGMHTIIYVFTNIDTCYLTDILYTSNQMWHFYSFICGFRNLIIEVQNYGRLRTYERDCWYKFDCHPKCQTSHVKLICVPNGNKNLSEKKRFKSANYLA